MEKGNEQLLPYRKYYYPLIWGLIASIMPLYSPVHPNVLHELYILLNKFFLFQPAPSSSTSKIVEGSNLAASLSVTELSLFYWLLQLQVSAIYSHLPFPKMLSSISFFLCPCGSIILYFFTNSTREWGQIQNKQLHFTQSAHLLQSVLHLNTC